MCRRSELTPLQFLFLVVLNTTEGRLNGAEIVKEIERNLGEDWTPSAGAVYKILQSLEDRGLISLLGREATPDKRMKYYEITPEGLRVLTSYMDEEARYIKFMNRCCQGMRSRPL